jgi:hypothetical protein
MRLLPARVPVRARFVFRFLGAVAVGILKADISKRNAAVVTPGAKRV